MSFQLFSSRLSPKGTGLRHYRLCCLYFSLPNTINAMYILRLIEMVPPPGQITEGFTLPMLYCISCSLQRFLKSLLHVIDNLSLTLTFDFINFSFQLVPSFVPVMSTSLTPYIVWLIYIHCSGLDPVTTAFSLLHRKPVVTCRHTGKVDCVQCTATLICF